MKNSISLAVAGILLGGLNGCGKSETREAPITAIPDATIDTAAAPVKKPDVVSTAAAPKGPVTYRTVKATLHGNNAKVEVLVPDDVDVDSGRMIEIRQGADGQYYLKSLIPN